MSKVTLTNQVSRAKQLILGTDKHYANGSQTIQVAGATFTVTALTQLMQDFVDNRESVEASKAATKAKIETERTHPALQAAPSASLLAGRARRVSGGPARSAAAEFQHARLGADNDVRAMRTAHAAVQRYGPCRVRSRGATCSCAAPPTASHCGQGPARRRASADGLGGVPHHLGVCSEHDTARTACRQAPRLVSPAPEDGARVREAFAESLRDEGRALTPEELRRWVETGEWPES
jgi:hypothetical protein